MEFSTRTNQITNKDFIYYSIMKNKKEKVEMKTDFDFVELENELGGMDFTGSLDEDGFNNLYEVDETEDELLNEFLYVGETNNDDYLITY